MISFKKSSLKKSEKVIENLFNGMGLSDAVNDWKDLISNIPTQYYAVLFEKYNFLFLTVCTGKAEMPVLLGFQAGYL